MKREYWLWRVTSRRGPAKSATCWVDRSSESGSGFRQQVDVIWVGLENPEVARPLGLDDGVFVQAELADQQLGFAGGRLVLQVDPQPAAGFRSFQSSSNSRTTAFGLAVLTGIKRIMSAASMRGPRKAATNASPAASRRASSAGEDRAGKDLDTVFVEPIPNLEQPSDPRLRRLSVNQIRNSRLIELSPNRKLAARLRFQLYAGPFPPRMAVRGPVVRDADRNAQSNQVVAVRPVLHPLRDQFLVRDQVFDAVSGDYRGITCAEWFIQPNECRRRLRRRA